MADHLPILDIDASPAVGFSENADGPAAERKGVLLTQALSPLVADGVLVAFSGGMDSAFLLWAASQLRSEESGRVIALTTTSPSLPAHDRVDAEGFSRLLKVEHRWEESKETQIPDYSRNDRERCYHCKTELFRIARRVAEECRLPWILYGYNASDHQDNRPGHRAALEAGALTPLSDAGLTKPEIRYLMEKAGLPLSTKPASPCLSSRIMTGIEITPHRLRDVDEMEEILRRGGVRSMRVRICRDETRAFFIRVEAPPEEMQKVLACRKALYDEGKSRGYRWVTLDLGGYRTGGGVS
jgi:uncharacterized protein